MVIQVGQVSGSARGAGAKRGAGYLVYDGDCAFCLRCVALLAKWDTRSQLRFVAFQQPAELIDLPFIPRAALEQAMHLVTPDDAIYAGADAVPPMLRVLPGGRLVAWVFAIPGARWLARRVYRVVARNRHRLGCGSSTCTLGGHR